MGTYSGLRTNQMTVTDEAWKKRLFSEYELKVKIGEVDPPNRTKYLLDIAGGGFERQTSDRRKKVTFETRNRLEDPQDSLTKWHTRDGAKAVNSALLARDKVIAPQPRKNRISALEGP